MPAPAQPPEWSPKRALRDQVLASRRRRGSADSAADAEAIARQTMAWDVVRRAGAVAAYVSVGGEPGTRLLLDALHTAGVRVLLPVLRADFDLDWGVFTGELVAVPRGLLEPAGPRLGVGAIAGADVVLAPGLAVSSSGDRLGQGGGCYDRALARVTGEVPVAVVLHEDEVGLDVPTEPHDRPVTHVVTPAGVRRLPISP